MACLYLHRDFIISITRTFLSPLAFLPLFSTLFSEEEKKNSAFLPPSGCLLFHQGHILITKRVRLCEKGGGRGKDPDGHH